MKTATITETKNNLSALIDRVRHGETILILDRGRPVAQLSSVITGEGEAEGRVERLERAGLLRRARKAPDDTLFERPRPTPGEGASGVSLLIEERRSGR